ncbi:hypothetical protein SAMN05216464_110268 [Mucilaginibacter pineti]|uniref:HEAT repeat-containing protein n=1 Tax=Mucilaginibacter pineti TaxID=1391627 RepID=A0A1G7GRZ4_9SPHI|nr:hypothetical protein [Mucilaginibacter pineti]SDE90917.1 hypothetical protein SAMN05216464_110268 [Mucilaginibacter pineti]
MPALKTIAIAFFTLFCINAKATTWDEPWHDMVVKQSDSFVLAKVTANDEQKGVTITILKQLGGKQLQGTIQITNFYLLRLCSTSAGEGPEFHFKNVDSCYFFIKQNDKKEYCIATPTAGFAIQHNGKVAATYRHSYHQARINTDVYEATMTAIFNNYHKLSYDKAYINSFVTKYLSAKPAGFEKEEIETFFNQHVALECVYHLGLIGYCDKIAPFLLDSANFHAKVSAARALSNCNTADNIKLLLAAIDSKENDGFVKVMCIWTLKTYKPESAKVALQNLEKTASTEENGFGGNIMDPRVCTRMPTVKEALTDLLAQLK